MKKVILTICMVSLLPFIKNTSDGVECYANDDTKVIYPNFPNFAPSIRLTLMKQTRYSTFTDANMKRK